MAIATETARKVFYSRHSYGEVVDPDCDLGRPKEYVRVRNERGKEWDVSRAIFDAEFKINEDDGTHQPKEVTRTELIETILANQRQIMVVTFRKKVKDTDVVKAAKSLVDEGVRTNSREFSRRIKEAVAGTPRIITGRHEGSFDDHGRLRFVDMEGKGLRLVDPRTVEKLLVGGRTYVVG